jgi:hypothetical protein
MTEPQLRLPTVQSYQKFRTSKQKPNSFGASPVEECAWSMFGAQKALSGYWSRAEPFQLVWSGKTASTRAQSNKPLCHCDAFHMLCTLSVRVLPVV